MMRHLTARGVKCPCPVVGVDGHDIARMNLPLRQGARDARRDHAVRVLTWVDGSIADDCRDAHTPAFMRELGAFLGRMVRALESFSHPGAERWHQWDNANALTVRKFMDAVEDPARRAIAEGVLDDFEAKVARWRARFEGAPRTTTRTSKTSSCVWKPPANAPDRSGRRPSASSTSATSTSRGASTTSPSRARITC